MTGIATVADVDIPAVASAVGQVASAALAVPTMFVAYFAYKISKSSAEATAALTRIEATRLQAELRPEIHAIAQKVPWSRMGPPARDALVVVLELVGPPALHQLDEATINLRPIFDDDPERLDGEPYYLADKVGPSRWSGPPIRTWVLGERQTMHVEISDEFLKSRPETYPPVRLLVECRYGTFEPWFVPIKTQVEWVRPHAMIPDPDLGAPATDVEDV